MSALAKKMMEKYGWKEGEGLGKERTGMKSYVKVVRRDPNVATGLGHAADPAQGGSLASTHAVELDAIYGQLHKEKKMSKRKSTKTAQESNSSSSSSRGSSSDSDAEGVDKEVSDDSNVPRRNDARTTTTTAGQKRTRPQDSSSSDDSDSDDDQGGERFKDEVVGDVTRMSDKDLFQRCGGVRLGRAGRHRFFDGKLKRIHETHHN